MFRQVTAQLWASPQIEVGDVARAKDMGIALIINNRPEDESPDQTSGDDISAAAAAAGLGYVALPVTHAGFSEPQVSAMAAAIAGAQGGVLAYCRSGTRSTLLWALAEASTGASPADLAAAAAGAGYDLGSIAPLLDMLAAKSRDSGAK
jgi:uncharacterized protein (TIGR01244 family)